MKLIFLLLTLVLFSCGKKLPDAQIRSLSGKNYHGVNARVSLMHDFQKGRLSVVDHSVKVPGGMFYSPTNFISPYGSEVMYFDNSTGKSELIADIILGQKGSNPSNFSYPGGDWVYFLANTENDGREIFRVNRNTFVIQQLPEGDVGSGDTFHATKHEEKGFIVIQENPLIAYGRKADSALSYKDGAEDIPVLHRYTYDWSNSPTYNAITASRQGTSNLPDIGGGLVYFDEPTSLTRMEEKTGATTINLPMVSFIVNRGGNSYFSAVKSGTSGAALDRTGSVSGVEQLVSITGGNQEHAPSHFLAGADNAKKVYEFSIQPSIAFQTIETNWGGGFSSGDNVTELIAHNDKLYWAADMTSFSCSQAGVCNSNPPNIGKEIGVYDPIGYDNNPFKGIQYIDVYTGATGSDPQSLVGAGIFGNDDRVCFGGNSGGTFGHDIVCIYATQTQAYIGSPTNQPREFSYSVSSYDIRSGALSANVRDMNYLDNESLVFNGLVQNDTFSLYHLNLNNSSVQTVGAESDLFLPDSGTGYYNSRLLHNSGKYVFETSDHNLLKGRMVRDDGVLLDAGLAIQKSDIYTASTNESSIPLLRFIDGSYYFGSNLRNKASSWVYNENTNTADAYDIGAIISDKFVKVGSRYYVSVNYRNRASIAWIDPITKTSDVIVKTCHDGASLEHCDMLHSDGQVMREDDAISINYQYVGVEDSLKLLYEFKGELFYLARGISETDYGLYRYNLSSGVINNIGRNVSPFNPIYNDQNVLIFGVYSVPLSKNVIVYSNSPTSINSISDSTSHLENYVDHFYDSVNKNLVINAYLPASSGYGVFELDLSDTANFNPTQGAGSDFNLVASLGLAANELFFVKDGSKLMGVDKTNDHAWVYNGPQHTAANPWTQNTITNFDATRKGNTLHAINAATGVYQIRDVDANLTDSDDLDDFAVTSCARTTANFYMLQNYVIEHCSNSEFRLHFRSTNQSLDLTGFGMGWVKTRTVYNVLYEGPDRTVISFMHHKTGDKEDVTDNKVIEIDHATHSINFIHNDPEVISRIKLEEGKFLACVNAGEGHLQMVLFDFVNNREEAISGDYKCLADRSSNTSGSRLTELNSKNYKVHNGYIKGVFSNTDNDITLGYELYKIRL